MNIVDVILIIVMFLILIGGIITAGIALYDEEIGCGITLIFLTIGLTFLAGVPFIVLDKGSGATIGEITSIDRNFFGTTALFIKTSENSQEEYCIENEDVVNIAKDLIGKKVKISYGERVGVYSTGSCSQAPIEKIELLEE